RFFYSLNMRVVFLAWEDTDESQTEGGEIFNRSIPDLRNKILNNFMGLCQVVAKLAVNPRTKQRGFILDPSNSVFAKNQISNDVFCLQEDVFKLGVEELNYDKKTKNEG